MAWLCCYDFDMVSAMIFDVGQTCALNQSQPIGTIYKKYSKIVSISYQNHIKNVSKSYQNRKTISKSYRNHKNT
jgi:hypothetical protein